MQDDSGIEAVAVVLGTVDAIAVAELVGQPIDADVPVVAGAVAESDRAGISACDLTVAGLGKDQPDGRAVPAEQDEIDAGRRRDRPGGNRAAAADDQEAVMIGELGFEAGLRRVDCCWHGSLRTDDSGSVKTLFSKTRGDFATR